MQLRERLAGEVGVEQRDDAAHAGDAEPDGHVLRPVRHQQTDDVALCDPLLERPPRIARGAARERAVRRTTRRPRAAPARRRTASASSSMICGSMRSGFAAMVAVRDSARAQTLAPVEPGVAMRVIASSRHCHDAADPSAHAVLPASTVRTVPVMLLAFDPSRNSTASATSPTSATGAARCAAPAARGARSSRPWVISVSEKAGRDRVHVDAASAHLAGQRSGEADQRRFRGAVDREAAVAGEADNRRDVDDAAAAVGQHVADHVLGQDDGRQHVQANQPLDVGVGHERQRAVRAQRGVVDEPVDRAELGSQLLDELPESAHVLEIERREAGSSPDAIARRPRSTPPSRSFICRATTIAQ